MPMENSTKTTIESLVEGNTMWIIEGANIVDMKTLIIIR